MALLALGILTAALHESDGLARTALLDDFRGHDCASHEGRADLGAGAFADDEDFLEFDLSAGFAFELLDGDDVVGGNLVLLYRRS